MLFLLQPISGVQAQVITPKNLPSTPHHFTVQNSPVNIQSLKASEYLIFLPNQEEFNGILSMFHVKQSYSNLRAVIVDLTTNQYNMAKSLYGSHIYETSKVGNFYAPKTVKTNPSDIVTTGLDTLKLMSVDKLYSLGYNGSGINVGIIDNGVNINHPALKGKITTQVQVGTGTLSYNHGTPVSGMIVADGSVDSKAYGTAVNASIYSVAMVETSAGSFTLPTVLAGMNRMLAFNKTVHIVNMSVGGGGNVFNDILKVFNSVNMLVVASAGNGGPGSTETKGPVGFPAGTIDAVAVGATDLTKKIAGFSSRGPTSSSIILKPDVVAPGELVYSTTRTGFGAVSGTSFSSPATAGALATLASALNAKGYVWNIGTLKAALIRGAEGTDGGNYNTGMGFVNIYNSYTYLMNQNSASTVARALAVTPTNYKLFRTNYFSEITTQIHGYTLITSHPNETSFSISGNLSSVLSVSSSQINNSLFSQEIPLTLNSIGASIAAYSGTLKVSLGTQSISIPITLHITGKAKAIMGFDLRHTDWDNIGADTLTGSNTGNMVNLAYDKGIWVETFNTPITSSLLSKFDIVWIPDPVDGTYDAKFPYTGANFLPSEITSLENYVSSGGNLLITFNGYFQSQGVTTGTNATAINQLIGKFGVNTFNNLTFASDVHVGVTANNFTSLTKGVGTLSQFGNFMSLDPSVAAAKNAALYPLTGDYSKTQYAAFDQIGGGRVIISDNNFWTDNGGSSGDPKYPSGDKILASNAYDWFLAKDKIIPLNMKVENRNIKLTVGAFSGGSPVSNLNAVRLHVGAIPKETLPMTSLGAGKFSLDYKATLDGIHVIQVANSAGEYVRLSTLLDLLPPQISTNLKNETYVDPGLQYIKFEFNITDSTYQVKGNDITIILDGNVQNRTEATRIVNGKQLIIVISVQNLDPNKKLHTLKIEAKDMSNNIGTFILIFQRGIAPSTTSTSKAAGGFLPFNFLPFVITLIGIFPLIQKYRKKLKRSES